MRGYLGITRAFNVDHLHSGRLNIEADRLASLYFSNFNTLDLIASWNWWITAHRVTFTLTGVVTVDGSPVAAGKTVEIYAIGEGGPETLTELVTTTTTSEMGDGSFSVEVPDNTRTYFASYVDGSSIGRSDDGTPGTDTFDITIGAAGRRFLGSPFIRRLR